LKLEERGFVTLILEAISRLEGRFSITNFHKLSKEYALALDQNQQGERLRSSYDESDP